MLGLKLNHVGKGGPGWDNVTVESLKHSGDFCLQLLTWMLNENVKNKNMPENFKKGLIVPIPKGDKEKTIKNNNRCITLISVIYKILEKVMLNREMAWVNNVVDELQGVPAKTNALVFTPLCYSRKLSLGRVKGATVYVTFIDIRKAFDTVWVNGL